MVSIVTVTLSLEYHTEDRISKELNILFARQPLVAPLIRAPCHVCENGPHVRVGPQRPLQVHRRPGLGGGVQRSGLGADDALAADTPTLEVDRSHVLDGAVGGDLAGDAVGGAVAHVRVLVGLVELGAS